jgi:type IV secretion system protein VirB6
MPSRAERLAYDLQRDQAQATARSRSASVAAAATAASARQISVTVGDTNRLGDAYRRSAFTARRAGASK